jgi:hypothetical protein
MNGIAGFLQKFLKFEKDNNTKISLILETIKKETGLELQKEILEIKGDNLKLNCNPVFRNEIFMHLSQINTSLQSQKIFLKIV